MARLLRKQDALVILYNKLYEDDFYYVIKITSKDGNENYYRQWMEFNKELDELCFDSSDEDWICLDVDYNKDRTLLKNELEKRGFNVCFGDILEPF
jgi:hypothetical protein